MHEFFVSTGIVALTEIGDKAWLLALVLAIWLMDAGILRWLLGLSFIAMAVGVAAPNHIDGEGEMNMAFSPEAFKGHTIFAWKESSGYSFVWLSSTNALIPRKRMVNASPISECVVTKRFKEMKGLRQHVFLYLIPDAPQALRFYTEGDIPKTSMDASLDLIERLVKLAKENQVYFVVSGSDGDRTLDGLNEAPQQEAQTDDFIGFAQMEADGTLILRLYAYLDDNDKSKGHVLGYLRYPPDHPEYENILRHVGPIKPGEGKTVRPWPETSDIECAPDPAQPSDE